MGADNCCAATTTRFEDVSISNDPFVRARNTVKGGRNGREDAVEKAMRILWAYAPRDVAMHGSEIERNLGLYWDALPSTCMKNLLGRTADIHVFHERHESKSVRSPGE